MRRLLSSCTFAVFAMTVVAHTTAQDGATALQQNYRTLLDNAQMQVVHVHFGPHETLQVHDHSHYPTVYVYLSNSGPVRFVHDEASPFTITRRPVKAGWFRVSPGRIERHQVANLSPIASDFLRVECKRIRLGEIRNEFRFSQDVDLTKTAATTDYSSSEMVIRRYIVATKGVEPIAAEAPGELLIAFTPAVVHERGKADQMLGAGSGLWIPAGADFILRPTGTVAAHALTIRLQK